MADEDNELEDLKVRLIGDSTEYERTLHESSAMTTRWQSDMEGAARGPQGELDELESELDDVNVAMEASGASLALWSVIAGLMVTAVAGATAGAFLLAGAWRRVVDEVEDADEAVARFGSADAERIRGAIDDMEALREEWQAFENQLVALSAGPARDALGWLTGALEEARTMMNVDPILGSLRGDVKDRGLLALFEFLDAQKRAREEMEAAQGRVDERLAQGFLSSELDDDRRAIERLEVALGLVTEESLAWERVLEEAGEQSDLLTEGHRELLESTLERRRELERQAEAMKEQKKQAEELDKQYRRFAEQSNQDATRGMGEQLRLLEDLARARTELSMAQVEADSRLQEVLGGGTFSAGAFVGEGTPEGRTLSRFGSAQETISKLLDRMERIDREAFKLQQKELRALQQIEQKTVPAQTLRNLEGVA